MNQAQKAWKRFYRMYTASASGYSRRAMRIFRREAALERALDAANRRAERAEARVNELEYVINLDDKSLEAWLGKIE